MLPTCLQYGRSYPCIKANLTHGVVSEFIHILNMQLLFFYGQASQNEVTHGRRTLICTRQSWDSDNQNVAEQLEGEQSLEGAEIEKLAAVLMTGQSKLCQDQNRVGFCLIAV